MAPTTLFKDIVKARVKHDPVFSAAWFKEAIAAFFEGETTHGKKLTLQSRTPLLDLKN